MTARFYQLSINAPINAQENNLRPEFAANHLTLDGTDLHFVYKQPT
jgi:hypothetical protein